MIPQIMYLQHDYLKRKKNYWINERWIRGKNTNNENDEYKK